MKCPKCGNEVGPDEAFCGQCGTPNMPPARPTEMVNTPSPRSGYLNTRNMQGTGVPGTTGAQGTPGTPSQNGAFPADNSALIPPTQPYQSMSSPPGSPLMPANAAPVQQPSPAWPTPLQQPTSFYQDATEAMPSMAPGSGQNYPGAYPSQNFPGIPMQGAYPGTGQLGSQAQAQPFQTGQPAPYNGVSYSPLPGFAPGQGYTGQSKLTPPPQKQTSTALIIACVFLVIALLAAVAFGTLYLTRRSSPKVAITPTVAPTAAPSPTVIPSPTPTLAPSPTPTTAPSPTVVPTPTPDPGFIWCDTTCTSNGYLVEYPSGWQQGQTTDATGVQFANPAQTDEFAAFKSPGVTSSSASQLVANDLQTNYSTKPGYQVTTPASASATTTIGGETWTYEIATYQNPEQNNTMEQITVYATVHQGKAYIIELQAPQNLYDTVNQQYFTPMLNRFQFFQSQTGSLTFPDIAQVDYHGN
ncbi:MAG TPA: zinc-ribbon domain-containing protein [Ktedonobacteraceae bacterium]|nr:zinc-ribbon domain-containing protein [Ktedonobacteraceae bacterium]